MTRLFTNRTILGLQEVPDNRGEQTDRLLAASKGNLASVCEEIRSWIWSADNTRKQCGALAKINSSDQKTAPK